MFEQYRALVYVLHSHDPRFTQFGSPLSLDRVLSNSLTPEEEQFYRLVIRDFCNNPEYEGTRRPLNWEYLPTVGLRDSD